MLALARALAVAMVIVPAASAAGGSIRIAKVTEIRTGLRPALSFRIAGAAPRGEGRALVYMAGQPCAGTGAEQGRRNSYRRLVVKVRGRFEEHGKLGGIPRALWSGQLCGYLESHDGTTVASAGRRYRLGTYRNPVYGVHFPDPMVLDVGNAHRDYYAYGTGDRFPILRSTDLVRWRRIATAFAHRPGWVPRTGWWGAWAPSVIENPGACPGAATGPCFVMYYGAFSAALQTQCIGVATSPQPAGPFTDHGILQQTGGVIADGRPIGCGDASGYHNIDPDPFLDRDGKAYLYLSTGESCSPAAGGGACRWRPTVSVMPLSADLLNAGGPRVPLFSGERGTWEQAPWGPVVEGPWMVRRGGTYVLFYSGGAWNGHYGMGYATARSPLGGFVKSSTNPLLSDSSGVISAGGGSLVTGPAGGSWVVYAGRSGSRKRPRTLRIDRVRWDRFGRPSIAGPTVAAQAPMP